MLVANLQFLQLILIFIPIFVSLTCAGIHLIQLTHTSSVRKTILSHVGVILEHILRSGRPPAIEADKI
jgi:hypothetical protein